MHAYPSAVDVEQQLFTGPRMQPAELESLHTPGTYAWWDEHGELAGFWPADLAPVDPARPLYVGQALKAFSQRATRMHLSNARFSTLRRSLASLLVDHLDLLPGATLAGGNKHTMFKLGDPAEERLTAWMHEHLTVSTVEHPSSGLVEGTVIGSIVPPLNDRFARHGPYWQRMAQHRADLIARIAGG